LEGAAAVVGVAVAVAAVSATGAVVMTHCVVFWSVLNEIRDVSCLSGA
jgi:hypothetical protein